MFATGAGIAAAAESADRISDWPGCRVAPHTPPQPARADSAQDQNCHRVASYTGATQHTHPINLSKEIETVSFI